MALTQLTNGMSGSDCRTNINASFTAVDALSYAPFDYGNTGTSPLAVDAANGLVQKATITANLTVSAPSNPVAGMEMSLAITASGAARTITLGTITVPTGYTFSGVIASGSVRRLKVYYTGSVWLLTSNLEFA